MIKSKTPNELDSKFLYNLLVGGVSPRPIALVSTISKEGVPNLAPFSFFNVFGMNPPCAVFSPVRRGRDGSLKDTLVNISETKECVIHAVPFKLVEQINVASTEFSSDVNEFAKSGLTPIPSDIVKPFRVKESPFQMECKLIQIVPVGESKGSANLVICEIVKLHYDEAFIKGEYFDPELMDLVGRNGGEFYTRASSSALFQIPRPSKSNCIGFDGLPEFLKNSSVLTANQIARLALSEKVPTKEEVLAYWKIKDFSFELIDAEIMDAENLNKWIHQQVISKVIPTWRQIEKYLGKIILQDSTMGWMLVSLYLKH